MKAPGKVASVALFSLLSQMAFAADITPTRVGPVSQYGQLITGKNSSNEGRIYGSCQGVTDGAEVQVRGMSLYWSLKSEAIEFWTEDGVSTMVKDMNIQIVRAAMATGNENWGGEWEGKNLSGYAVDPNMQKQFVRMAVEAAIKNDIYVIIDWHSHNAHNQTEQAKAFFSEMAREYGSYDNVIFEIYNEPTDISWNEIRNYANSVIPAIREYSDNLILVGTRSWDQHPEEVIGKEVTDSKNNTAYTLHYYAMSHCASGNYSWGGSCEGSNGEKAIKAGLSVFISEWGTGNADGDGYPGQSENDKWQTFVNQYKLSWANWSASKIPEGTAAFSDGATRNNLQYTASGNMVKGYLASNPSSYTKCATGNPEPPTPSAISALSSPKGLSLNAASGKLFLLSNASNVKVEIFDYLGHVKSVQEMSVRGEAEVDISKLSSGTYLVRARDGKNVVQTKFQVK